MNIFIIIAFTLILFLSELIYFKIADKYNIIDSPNHRSSHTIVTKRGGGIIFTIALLLGSIYFGWKYDYFLSGLLLISLISFLDDIRPVSNKIKILFHLVAVALLFMQLNIYNLPFYWIIFAFVFVIGTINAINFMDGINGITGGYSLTTIITLFYINKYLIVFTDDKYLILSIISLLVFNFFNFRTKAKCFAGDVGSVSMAFIMVFFICQLIIKTNNPAYLLLLSIYGLDTVTTILFRLSRKENIFEPHRTHFYQFLANEKKMPHLWVAASYSILQLIINYIFIYYFQNKFLNILILVAFTIVIFILTRVYLEGMNGLKKKF
jgi:UDP-GlcNAc:undecaprenyl-phosphate GlcNAc-1-phosphate transferase